MTKITYAFMTQNRLSENIACLERVLPYVDRAIVIDGGSQDDTIFYMRNWAQEEPKLEFYLCPWRDDFSWQRNNYLSKVEDNTWVLVSNPDEQFEIATLEAMQEEIRKAELIKKDMIGFQCRSVTLKGNKRVWESLDNYHKRLLFKKHPGTVYEGNPHERLRHHPQRWIDTKLVYEHLKQENVTWHRGARNMFCGGGGPNLGKNNPRWIHLRDITSTLGIETWHQFDAYMLKGNIDQRVKDWMIQYHIVDGFDGASEHRELYKLYFRIYHPTEEPVELRSVHIP